MAITVTDIFAGAGGSSTGMAQVPGVHVEIAAEYGVSTGAIMHACQRRTWRHVA